MKHLSRLLNIVLIVGLLSFAFSTIAFAQESTPTPSPELLALFAPVLAATVAIERILQLVRNIFSPNPEQGLLARGSKALRYFTTLGGVALGLIFAFAGGIHMFQIAEINIDLTLDATLTGITMGMGTEFVHQVIMAIGEGKNALRKTAK
ncbi:MAG: hypothetical protein Fur0022_08840 [Anaerolineales bacterium]